MEKNPKNKKKPETVLTFTVLSFVSFMPKILIKNVEKFHLFNFIAIFEMSVLDVT